MIHGLYDSSFSNLIKPQETNPRTASKAHPDKPAGRPPGIPETERNVPVDEALNNIYSKDKMRLQSVRADVDALLKDHNGPGAKGIADALLQHHPEGVRDMKEILDRTNGMGLKRTDDIHDQVRGMEQLGAGENIRDYVNRLKDMMSPEEYDKFIDSCGEFIRAHSRGDFSDVRVNEDTGIYGVEPTGAPVNENDSIKVEMNFKLFFSLSEQIRERHGSGPQGRFHEVSRQVAGRFEMDFSLRIEGIRNFLGTTEDIMNAAPESYEEFIEAAAGLRDLNPEALDHFIEATQSFISELKETYGDRAAFDDVEKSLISTAESFISEVHRGVNEVFPEIYSLEPELEGDTPEEMAFQKDLPSLIDMVRRLFNAPDRTSENILEESLKRFQENIDQNLAAREDTESVNGQLSRLLKAV